jgi:putative FmdB family regulatory protein
MPTYGYICEKCGDTFEIVQPISARTLTVCPQDHCRRKPWGKGRVKREITGGAGLLFKGSGFYITDYRSEKYKEAAKKDSATPATASADAKTTKAGDTAASAPAKPAKDAKSKPAGNKT